MERLKIKIPKHIHTEQSYKELSPREKAEKECKELNELEGSLKGYDCRACKNKGVIYIVKEDNEIVARICKCKKTRDSLKLIKKSGLENLLKIYTFKSYIVSEQWQKDVITKVSKYLKDNKGSWFFFGGQPGCGKTHICTALVGKFIKGLSKSAKYMLWRDDIVTLKAIVNDSEAYEKEINIYKDIDVLYIDDFFKTGNAPTPADKNLAFEIINYRYNDPNKITIISSELSIDEIIQIDEATGSRIFERTKDYCLYVRSDRNKNYRLRSEIY